MLLYINPCKKYKKEKNYLQKHTCDLQYTETHNCKEWKSVKKSFIISCEQIEVLRLAVDDRRTVKLNADTEFIQGHVIVCQNYNTVLARRVYLSFHNIMATSWFFSFPYV